MIRFIEIDQWFQFNINGIEMYLFGVPLFGAVKKSLQKLIFYPPSLISHLPLSPISNIKKWQTMTMIWARNMNSICILYTQMYVNVAQSLSQSSPYVVDTMYLWHSP